LKTHSNIHGCRRKSQTHSSAGLKTKQTNMIKMLPWCNIINVSISMSWFFGFKEKGIEKRKSIFLRGFGFEKA